MKCFNCECDLIIDINKSKNIDTNKIVCKYKNYNFCVGCYDNFVEYGFLGDINNPILVYEKEKVNLGKFKKKK